MGDRAAKESVVRRLLLVGGMLLSGPVSMYPRDADGQSYLSSSLFVLWHSETFDKWRSVRVYTDGNGSDEEGYLEPIMRCASWHREADIRLQLSWPNVLVDLGGLPIDSPQLQATVRSVQEHIARVPFAAQGLPVRRNFGAWSGDGRGRLTVKVISGWQDRELSVDVGEAPELYETSLRLEAELRRIATPVHRHQWLERYDWSPDELLTRKSWYWDGQPS
jgi:hypothetical protein